MYKGCAPGCATCHISDFTFVSSDTSWLTLFLSNNLQDLTAIHIQCSYGPSQGVFQVAPHVTVMATVSPDAFSRKTLFLLESHISINQAKYFSILLIEDMFHKLQILKFKLCYVKVFHSDGLLPVLMPTNTRHWFWIIAAVIATLNLYWCHLLFSFSSLYGVVSVETQIYRLPYCEYLSIQVLKEYGR